MALVDGVGMEAMMNIGLVVDEELLAGIKQSIFVSLLASGTPSSDNGNNVA